MFICGFFTIGYHFEIQPLSTYRIASVCDLVYSIYVCCIVCGALFYIFFTSRTYLLEPVFRTTLDVDLRDFRVLLLL